MFKQFFEFVQCENYNNGNYKLSPHLFFFHIDSSMIFPRISRISQISCISYNILYIINIIKKQCKHQLFIQHQY